MIHRTCGVPDLNKEMVEKDKALFDRPPEMSSAADHMSPPSWLHPESCSSGNG